MKKLVYTDNKKKILKTARKNKATLCTKIKVFPEFGQKP